MRPYLVARRIPRSRHSRCAAASRAQLWSRPSDNACSSSGDSDGCSSGANSASNSARPRASATSVQRAGSVLRFASTSLVAVQGSRSSVRSVPGSSSSSGFSARPRVNHMANSGYRWARSSTSATVRARSPPPTLRASYSASMRLRNIAGSTRSSSNGRGAPPVSPDLVPIITSVAVVPLARRRNVRQRSWARSPGTSSATTIRSAAMSPDWPHHSSSAGQFSDACTRRCSAGDPSKNSCTARVFPTPGAPITHKTDGPGSSTASRISRWSSSRCSSETNFMRRRCALMSSVHRAHDSRNSSPSPPSRDTKSPSNATGLSLNALTSSWAPSTRTCSSAMSPSSRRSCARARKRAANSRAYFRRFPASTLTTTQNSSPATSRRRISNRPRGVFSRISAGSGVSGFALLAFQTLGSGSMFFRT